MLRRKRAVPAAAGVVEVNPNVANVLAPSAWHEDEAGRSYLVGSSWRSTSYVRDFESMIDVNWGDVLFSRPGSVTTFVCRPSDESRLRSSIDHSNARQGMTLAEGSSASKMEEAERVRDHGKTMLRIMGDANERFFDTAVFQTTVAEDPENLRKQANSLASLAAGRHLTVEPCALKQEDAWWAASPWWTGDERIWQRYGRDMCASTLAAALAFQDNSLDDGVGTTLGWCEPDRSMCRVDMTTPSDERTNFNIWASGASGVGKTYLAGKILLSEWAQGARIMAIDPERQFKAFAKNACGQWINAGGGVRKGRGGRLSGACFSPLQPRLGNFSLEDDDAVESAEEAYRSDTQEVLRATLTYFHGWAELAWSTTPDDTPLLDHGLIAAYARYGIDFESTASELVEDHYPVMEDLRQCYQALADEADDENRRRAYQRLADKAEQCCEHGIYGNLWAHRTNVDITSDVVVFDTYELMEAEDHIRTAQLFSILSWIWSQACVSRVTKQFLRVLLDEGHLLFGGGSDRVSVTAAAYVNMMQKRIRKYNGGILFATQQLADAIGGEVKRYGESLLTSATYKYFFSTNTTDLKLLSEVMDFTPTIETLVGSKFKRGDCLLVAGHTKAHVHIEALRFEEEFFAVGKAA